VREMDRHFEELFALYEAIAADPKRTAVA